MTLFRDTIASIKKNKENVEQGKANCIPFVKFKRLSEKIPGIIQGTNWNVSANSGVGKTQFTKSAFVLEPVAWVEANPDKGISIKILYFALEESKQEFIYSMISHKLKQEYQLMIDPLELASMYADQTITDDILEKIASLEEYFTSFFSKVEIVDSISNPYGIYKYIRNYSRDNGTHYYYNFKTDKEKKKVIVEDAYQKLGEAKKEYAYSHYVPHNPDEYVICIIDHVSLLHPENGSTLHQAMNDMSAKYGRKQITKHFNYIFVEVQQQTAATESNVYTNSGDKIIEKLKPSLAGLADNKLTARNAHVCIGLFAPVRYDIKDYRGYNISRLQDQYRSLLIMKNRIGRGNIEVPLFYNGAITQFQEMPQDPDAAYYAAVDKVQSKMR